MDELNYSKSELARKKAIMFGIVACVGLLCLGILEIGRGL